MFHPAELMQWYEERTNRRVQARPDASAFWSLFKADGLSLSGAPGSLLEAARAPTDLLIVLTTFQRARLCERQIATLPDLLAQAGRPLDVQLLVLCDASDDDYSAARSSAERQFGKRVTWLDAQHWLGKPGYWQTYQAAFFAAQLLRPEHTLFLQDDVQYTANLLRDTYRLWDSTADDPLRRVLYLFSSKNDEANGRWIRQRVRELPGRGLRLTQWFDLQSYFVDRAFFELLEHRLVPIHKNRWRRRPGLSSGVGAQLTRRLFGRANIYQASPALVLHGAHESKMNPRARALRSLDNLALERSAGLELIC